MDFQKTWKVRFCPNPQWNKDEQQTLLVRTNDFSQIERATKDAWMNWDVGAPPHGSFSILSVEFVGYLGLPRA